MQTSDGLIELCDVSVVPDHIVGDRQSLFPARLCGQYATSGCLVAAVARQQSLDLRLLITVDQKYAIHLRSHRGRGQQRDDDELIIPWCRLGLPKRLVPNQRMQYRLERCAVGIGRENALPHGAAIELPVFCQCRVTEGINDRLQAL